MEPTLTLNPTPAYQMSELSSQAIANQSAGTRICQRMETIAFAALTLRAAAQFTINYGAEATCALTSIAAGFADIAAGNFFFGTFKTLAGAQHIYKMLCGYKTDVTSLLQDASAGMDMIKTLNEANQKSFDHMNANLNLVSQNVQALEKSLQDINNLATHGSKKLEKKKLEVTKLYRESDALFKEAQSIFNQSREELGQSSAQFEQALSKIEELVNLAKQEGGDFKERVDQFSKLSNQIYSECLEAKGKLDEGNARFDQGLQLFTQALSKYNRATLEAGKAMGEAQSRLEKIKSRAKIQDSCQAKIAEVKSEVAEIKLRNKEIGQIANEVQSDVEDAQKQMGMKFGLESLILGGGLGAFTGAIVSGGTAAGAGAVAGTVAYHNRQTIGNVLIGKDPEPEVEKPTATNPVTHAFNPFSSGWWGRHYEKRPSRTLGKLAIDLGEGQIMSLSFDLNAKHKISRKDAKNLYKQLAKQLNEEDKQISPVQLKQNAQRCLTILTKLESTLINRGENHRACKGFIYNDDPYFAGLKRDAKRLIG